MDLRGIDARRKLRATPDSRPTHPKGERIGWRESWYLQRPRIAPQIRGVRFQPKRRQKRAHRPQGVVRSLLVDLRGIEPLSENRRYDFLRGQSLYWNSPLAAPGDRFCSQVAVLCVTGSTANPRFTFTADLTPNKVRSPPLSDGRLMPRHCRQAASASFFLESAFNFR